jgi:hypothetical protein
MQSLAAQGPNHNELQLTMFLNRLEAATSRLEDIASSVDGPQTGPNGLAVAAATSSSASPSTPEQPPPPPEPLPRSIEAFDNIIEEDVGAFVTSSQKIGGLVEEQVCQDREGGPPGGALTLRRQKLSKKHSRPNALICW